MQVFTADSFNHMIQQEKKKVSIALHHICADSALTDLRELRLCSPSSLTALNTNTPLSCTDLGKCAV